VTTATAPPPTTERQRIRALLKRCHNDPALFNHVFLRRRRPDGTWTRGDLWWRQAEICRSVVNHRVTVVSSGNAIGKDYVVGTIVPWWLLTRRDSLVIVTGPSQTLLGSVTWKEIRKAIDGARFPLGATLSSGVKTSPQTVTIGHGWQALGYSTTSVERASGQHAGELLVIVEEASAVEDEAWDAVSSLKFHKMLIIGNPLRSEGGFCDWMDQAESDRRDGVPPRLAANHIRIPSTDSPHATWEHSPVGLADKTWIDAETRRHGENSLWVRSHIHAIRPTQSHEALLEPAWIERMAGASRDPHARPGKRRGATDLGEGVGRDRTVLMVADDLGILECVVSNRLGIPEAAGEINRLMSKWDVPQDRWVYDASGRGKDLPRYLAEYGITEAIAYHGGASGGAKAVNRRSKMGERLRRRLDPRRPRLAEAPKARPAWYKPSVFDPPDPAPIMQIQPPFVIPPEPDRSWWPALERELKGLRYRLRGNDSFELESKEEYAARLGCSPDLVDTLLMLMVLEAA
jgi:hypothetical protein